MQLRFEWVEKIDSTNSELRRRCLQEQGPEQGLVLSANEQTGGRGRNGHQWISPAGASISTSLLLRPKEVPIALLPRITILAAVASSRAIEHTTGLKTQIKWPNDILLHGKKLVGILSEMSVQNHQAEHVIVGIGVNVSQRSYAAEIADKAISLCEALEQKGADPMELDRQSLLERIWENFVSLYERYLQEQSLDFIREEYQSKLVNYQNWVRVLAAEGAYEALCLGINRQGELLIEREGKEFALDAGEVQVRGLRGYI